MESSVRVHQYMPVSLNSFLAMNAAQKIGFVSRTDVVITRIYVTVECHCSVAFEVAQCSETFMTRRDTFFFNSGLKLLLVKF